jgi:hypothetical protein
VHRRWVQRRWVQRRWVQNCLNYGNTNWVMHYTAVSSTIRLMNIKSVYKFDYKIRGKYGVSSDPRFGQGVRRLVAAFNIPLYLPKDLPTLTIPVSVSISICKYPRYKPFPSVLSLQRCRSQGYDMCRCIKGFK